MINVKRNLFAIPAVAMAALLASASVFGQLDSTRATSDISVVVDATNDVSVLPLIIDSPESDLMVYDLAANEIQFMAGVVSPDYDEPLFCFDMGGAQSAVGMRVTDPNGHLIVRDFAVDVSLDYVLGAPSSLVVRPAADQQCFFRAANPNEFGIREFGLFGQVNTTAPAGTIMRSRFEIERSISLEYEDVPGFVTLGETITYKLVVKNTGDGDLNEVALQELFPENLGVYNAVLRNTTDQSGKTWSCAATGDAVCPTESFEPSALRFKDFNSGGVDITEDDSLIFTITRTVDANSVTGGSIQLWAGVLADPIATDTPFAVAKASMTVTGASAGLSFSATEAVANNSDFSTITVTVLDANNNPVPEVTVNFDSISPATTAVLPTSGVSDQNGEVVFDSGTTETMGIYKASFSTDTLNGSVDIMFDHGPAANWYVYPVKTQAVADGSDAVAVDVEVEDANGNPVDSIAVDVTNSDGLASISNQEFTNVDGMATFTATSTNVASHALEFSVSGLGTTPQTVEFVAGDPAGLQFTQQPSNVVGDGFTTMSPAPALRVVDANSNLISDDSSTYVLLKLVDSNSNIVDSNIGSGTVINGEIQFPELAFDSALAGGTYRIRASGEWVDSSGNPHFFGTTSTSFDITSQ